MIVQGANNVNTWMMSGTKTIERISILRMLP